MAVFSDVDWSQFDFWAIVAGRGLAAIDERRRPRCHEWLRRHGYEIDSLDCSRGLAHLVTELGRLFRWEEQFGYSLAPDNGNLAALHDGFWFEVSESGGRVFELHRADLAWEEDSRWLLGLLGIAREHSHRQLALGRRFFTLLVLPQGSPLVGEVIEDARVPGPYHHLCRELNEFEEEKEEEKSAMLQ